jgi:serine/threonine-protein kinase
LESSARVCDVDGAVLDLVVVASERDRLVGTTILNRYAVDKVLGDGGMGVVYRATDTETGQRYAVKVLRAEYSAEEDLVLRFEQEARAAAAVNNPHIVEIYDWGSLPDGSRFFVMEYLEGRSLGDLLARMPRAEGSDRRQPLPEDFALHISMQIAEGLAAAHEIGIVHRDIKPDNFHIVKRPEDPYFIKILDFGIAKVQNSKAARTRTGSVFGTPHYMSPEQASGDKNIDDKTDIYGLGVMMYEMVVGKIPFDADNLMGILTAHLYHTPVPPSVYPECEKLSKSFEAVILKCLAKEREARYHSMKDLYADLARCRRGETSEALDDQEANTRRFTSDDFSADAATVIRQLPPSLMPASTEEVNAALGFHGAPSTPSGGHAGVVVHSTSLPAPAPAAMVPGPTPPRMSLPAPVPSGPGPAPSPFEAVGRIQLSNGVMPGPTPPSSPSGAEMSRPRNNTRMIVGAILGVGVLTSLAILGVASLQTAGGSAPREVDPALAVQQQQLQPGRVAAQNDTAPVPSVPVLPSSAHVVPQAQTTPVTIQASVPGARVYRAGVQVGTVPHQVTRPAGSGEETYTVLAEGYQEQSVIVRATSPSSLFVTLEAIPAVPSNGSSLRRRERRSRTGERPPRASQNPPQRSQPPPPGRQGDLHNPWSS